MLDTAIITAQVNRVLREAVIAELPNHYHGKVRESYDLPNGTRLIVATDRLSAFDRNIVAIPFKGEVLTQLARFWFEETKILCPNHVIDYPDANVLLGWRVDIIPVEIIVRDYLAGSTATSIWPMYERGAREIYGIRFPDGLHKFEKLPNTIITPTTKAFDGAHDKPLTVQEILDRGLLTPGQWDEISAKALALFRHGREVARNRGLILVDTKYEFGFNRQRNIILADEVHTPDSSRYWLLESYERLLEKGEPPESFDKDYVRRWVTAKIDPYRDPIPAIPEDIIVETSRIYIRAYEKITGKAFTPQVSKTPVIDRIRQNVSCYFSNDLNESTPAQNGDTTLIGMAI
jgi:phosphoribosylaminoimidazole-succinocarboxamide synthase